MRKILASTRKKAKLTQSQLADKLKITLRQYQRIESGEILGKVDMWDSLEDLFKVPQRKLRENSNESTNNSVEKNNL